MPEAVTAATQPTPVPAPIAPAGEKPAEKAPETAAAAPPVSPEAKPDPMGPRFAALAKQAQAVAREKQALAAARAEQERSLKAQREAFSSRAAKAEELEKRLAAAKSDPASFLRSVYGDEWYSHLTEVQLSGGKATPDLAVQALREESKAEIERIRKEQEDRWNSAEAERKAAQEAARAAAIAEQQSIIEDWQADTLAFVKGNAEKYELINETGQHQTVLDVIQQTYEAHKKLLTREEAADAVEKYLEEQAEKVFKGKKWQSRLAPQKPAEERPSSEAPRTLTNTAAAGASSPGQVSLSGAKKDRATQAAEAMQAVYRAGGVIK